jgi:hypothetical protein
MSLIPQLFTRTSHARIRRYSSDRTQKWIMHDLCIVKQTLPNALFLDLYYMHKMFFCIAAPVCAFVAICLDAHIPFILFGRAAMLRSSAHLSLRLLLRACIALHPLCARFSPGLSVNVL